MGYKTNHTIGMGSWGLLPWICRQPRIIWDDVIKCKNKSNLSVGHHRMAFSSVASLAIATSWEMGGRKEFVNHSIRILSRI
jgi:hypothetical protein